MTPRTARRYAEELRLLLLTIGASDAAMESGQMRVEANVSLRPLGSEAFGTRVEVKNMNSFRSVERAIDFEIGRQAAALRAGTPLIQETRGWDDDRGVTYHMRTKESSDDYRYFPEPDLPPLRVEAAWLEEIGRSMPELPAARRQRYRDRLGLSAYDADVLVGDLAATALFESARAADASLSPKKLANWVTGESLRLAKGEAGDAATGGATATAGAAATAGPERPVAGGSVAGVSGVQLAALVRMVEEGAVSGTSAKAILAQHARTGRPVAELVAEAGVQQISDAESLRAAVAECPGREPRGRGGRAGRSREGVRLPHRAGHAQDGWSRRCEPRDPPAARDARRGASCGGFRAGVRGGRLRWSRWVSSSSSSGSRPSRSAHPRSAVRWPPSGASTRPMRTCGATTSGAVAIPASRPTARPGLTRCAPSCAGAP